MIAGQDIFDQALKNDMGTYDKIWEITTGRGDDYTACYLLDYHYFKELYKFIAIGFTIQQALGADPKAM